MDVNGLYQILLRIEASDDKEGDVNLEAAGAGTGILPTGAVAGFPLPVLRYFVGGAGAVGTAGARLRLLEPTPDAGVAAGALLVLSWSQTASAVMYRLQVRGADGEEVLAAVLQAGVASYAAPPFLTTDHAGETLEWRVLSLDGGGDEVERTPWQRLRVEG
jgi:hypothetical protein